MTKAQRGNGTGLCFLKNVKHKFIRNQQNIKEHLTEIREQKTTTLIGSKRLFTAINLPNIQPAYG